MTNPKDFKTRLKIAKSKLKKEVLSDNEKNRRAAVMELLPFQKEDFKGILKAMEGKPVTIRLLDPPLHEFITLSDEQIIELASSI